jgi:hypothetical protein
VAEGLKLTRTRCRAPYAGLRAVVPCRLRGPRGARPVARPGRPPKNGMSVR